MIEEWKGREMNKKGNIIFGKSGGGKSYYILSKLINNKKKNIVINLNTIANKNYYLTNFPYLQDYNTYSYHTMKLDNNNRYKRKYK